MLEEKLIAKTVQRFQKRIILYQDHHYGNVQTTNDLRIYIQRQISNHCPDGDFTRHRYFSNCFQVRLESLVLRKLRKIEMQYAEEKRKRIAEELRRHNAGVSSIKSRFGDLVCKPAVREALPAGWRTVKPVEELLKGDKYRVAGENVWKTLPEEQIGKYPSRMRLAKPIVFIRADVPPTVRYILPGEPLSLAEWVWKDRADGEKSFFLEIKEELSGVLDATSMEVYIRRIPKDKLKEAGIEPRHPNYDNIPLSDDDANCVGWPDTENDFPKKEAKDGTAN